MLLNAKTDPKNISAGQNPYTISKINMTWLKYINTFFWQQFFKRFLFSSNSCYKGMVLTSACLNTGWNTSVQLPDVPLLTISELRAVWSDAGFTNESHSKCYLFVIIKFCCIKLVSINKKIFYTTFQIVHMRLYLSSIVLSTHHHDHYDHPHTQTDKLTEWIVGSCIIYCIYNTNA